MTFWLLGVLCAFSTVLCAPPTCGILTPHFCPKSGDKVKQQFKEDKIAEGNSQVYNSRPLDFVVARWKKNAWNACSIRMAQYGVIGTYIRCYCHLGVFKDVTWYRTRRKSDFEQTDDWLNGWPIGSMLFTQSTWILPGKRQLMLLLTTCYETK